jgi:hypothetical protein
MEEQSSTNRILLVVGFLTVLFLFKEYAASGMVPDLEVFGAGLLQDIGSPDPAFLPHLCGSRIHSFSR